MDVRTAALALLGVGIVFWGVGFVASLLGNLTAGNVWYAVSAVISIASAAVGLVAVRPMHRR